MLCITIYFTIIMKHFRSLKNLALGALAILLAAGCAKVDDTPRTPISSLAVYQTSPDAPKVSFHLNSSIINGDSAAYGTYGVYLPAYSGTRELSVYQGAAKKISASVTLKDGSIYSAYLTGRWAAPELVLLEDSLSNPPSGKANIRFVNMSVDAPSLDLVNSNTVVISGREYKKNSNFTAVTGNNQYSFSIREHGSTVDKVVIPSVTIQNGRIYTIVAKGFYNGTGATGISADVLTNY